VLDATVAVGLTSNANGLAGLTNEALTGQSVAVTGAAYDYAQPTVAATLALGNVRANTVGSLAVANTLVTSAEFQDSLDVTAATAIANLLVTAPANIVAGQASSVGLAIGAAGSLGGTITLGLTSNANGVANLQNLAFADRTVTVTGSAYA
jgi:hypothetical protein